MAAHCPGCGTDGEEMTRNRGYSCPNRDCGVFAFGTGDMPGVGQR